MEIYDGILHAAQPYIERHEGRRLRVYPDGLGIPTIAIGLNLEDSDARRLCETCGADYDRLLSGKDCLTDEQCDYLYQQKAIQTLEWMTRIFPEYSTYTLNRKIALLDMGYNLGEPRFLEFGHFIASVRANKWSDAKYNALDSIWARQVKGRAIEDTNMLEEG